MQQTTHTIISPPTQSSPQSAHPCRSWFDQFLTSISLRVGNLDFYQALVFIHTSSWNPWIQVRCQGKNLQYHATFFGVILNPSSDLLLLSLWSHPTISEPLCHATYLRFASQTSVFISFIPSGGGAGSAVHVHEHGRDFHQLPFRPGPASGLPWNQEVYRGQAKTGDREPETGETHAAYNQPRCGIENLSKN